MNRSFDATGPLRRILSGSSARVLGIFLCVAVLTRLLLVLALPLPPLTRLAIDGEGDSRYYIRLAQNLATSGLYAEGYLRAYRPPGYPVALSAFLVLGLKAPAIQVAQNLLYLCSVCLLALWAIRIGGDRAGVFAVAFAVLSPTWLVLPQRLLSETFFLFLMISGAWIGLRGPGVPGFKGAIGAGAVFGLAALVRETGLLLGFALAIVLARWCWRTNGRGRAIALGASTCIACLAVILPWTVRNAVVLGTLVPISTNGPINLYMGNNPAATGAYRWNLPADAQTRWNRPDSGPVPNEILASRSAGKAAVEFIKANPSRAIGLVTPRLWALWGPPFQLHSGTSPGALARDLAALLWFGLLLAGLVGTWRLRAEPIGQFVFLACVIGTGVHAVTYGAPRYRSAYEFLLLLPAAVLMSSLLVHRLVRRPTASPPG